MKKSKTIIDLNEADVVEEYPEKDSAAEPSLFEEEESKPEVQEPGVVEVDALQRYMGEINRYPLLQPEEEKRLATFIYRNWGPGCRV